MQGSTRSADGASNCAGFFRPENRPRPVKREPGDGACIARCEVQLVWVGESGSDGRAGRRRFLTGHQPAASGFGAA